MHDYVPDKFPSRMTLGKAYQAIYNWYKANVQYFLYLFQDQPNRLFTPHFFELVENLPLPEEISDIEIKAILREVIAGHLEACFGASDGKYKMSVYARAGLKAIGDTSGIGEFTDEDIESLKNTTLWLYLKYGYYYSDNSPDVMNE